MWVGGKGAVDCVALWDDYDIKQQNYRSKPHKVWKVTKIGQLAPFLLPPLLTWQVPALTDRT
jgi:hypothetical protein